VRTGVALAIAITMTVPAAVGAQTPIRPSADQQLRHDKISIMEGTLQASVGVAAKQVAKGVKSIDSSADFDFMLGVARAKGFTLEGHGVFFYVEVPTLDLRVMMNLEQLFERSPQVRAGQQQPQLDAQQVNDLGRDPKQEVPTAAVSLANIAAEGQKYRATVRLALIDAMLDSSKNLELRPDEWLTIAARNSEFGLSANEILNLTTTLLRVKGSDLADFLAGRLTKEEARQKVEVREF
jgi:hypothetical protein